MYDTFKNKKSIKKSAGNFDEEFFDNLSKTLYATSIRVYQRIEKFQNLNRNAEKWLTLEGTIEEFLQTPIEKTSKLRIEFQGPIALLYKLCVKEYFESNFTIKNDEIKNNLIKRFEKNTSISFKFIYSEILNMFSSCNSFVSMNISGKRYKANEDYLSFCEDDDTFKFVFEMHFHPSLSISRKVGLIFINIYYVSNEKADEKIHKVMENLAQFIRNKKIITHGAYNVYGEKIEISRNDWSKLKINNKLRDEINFHIIDYINNIQEIKQRGMKTNRGIIICGHQGTGKTLFLRTLISNLKIPSIIVGSQDIVPSSNPATTEMFNNIYNFAQYISPLMVIFEDGDLFLGKRATNMHASMLSQFLNKIDGIEENDGVITIVTSNQPELLDETVKNRPKRFDYILEFPLPEFEERYEILCDNLQEYLDDSLKEYLYDKVKELNGYSGAHITEIAERMKYHLVYNKQLKTLTKEIIDKVIDDFNFKKIKNGETNSIGFS